MLPILVGVGFGIFTFATGIEVTESHAKILDYLLIQALGSGATGAALSGMKHYKDLNKQG